MFEFLALASVLLDKPETARDGGLDSKTELAFERAIEFKLPNWRPARRTALGEHVVLKVWSPATPKSDLSTEVVDGPPKRQKHLVLEEMHAKVTTLDSREQAAEEMKVSLRFAAVGPSERLSMLGDEAYVFRLHGVKAWTHIWVRSGRHLIDADAPTEELARELVTGFLESLREQER